MKRSLLLCLALAVVPGIRASSLSLDRPKSWVEVDVKATVGAFAGHLGDFDFSGQADDATGRVTGGILRGDFASIKTGNAERDRDMNDWQLTGKYPEVVFVLDTLDVSPAGAARARGRLRLHGMERALSFPITVQGDARAPLVTGEVALDTRDYGLPVIRKFLVLKVDPVVRVRFHVQIRRMDPP